MLETFQSLFAPPRHMILLVIATWLGLTFAEKRTEQYGISKDDLNNITFYGMIAFVLGGRLTYILQNVSAFSKSPLGIISVNPDLFDPIGALAIAGIVTYAYAQRKQLPFWNILDALTLFFAVISIGMGLSHLAAGTAFGIPTDQPWGINMWNATRHPTQIYDALASFLTLALLWSFKLNPRPGITFLSFIVLTALSQLITQAFRADTAFIFNGLRQTQVLAWATLILCFILIEARFSSKHKTG